jgi:hypothetical protein
MKGLTYSFIVLLFLCAAPSLSFAQDHLLVKDLAAEWLVFQNGQYVPYHSHEEQVRNIYFALDANKYRDSFLQVSSPEPLTLFINGRLVKKTGRQLVLSIDSLAKTFHSSILQINIYQEDLHPGGLRTSIQMKGEPSSDYDEHLSMQFSSFRDFAIIGILILLIMLIIIIQINPKLTADYFSITKIFSMREGEDGQSSSRITSSINILFYAYCSLMLGYFLMIIFHYVPAYYASALSFQANTFWVAIVQWLELSLLVLAVCFAKIAIVYSLSFVFGMPEVGGIHFFNWVRLLLGVFGILTVVLFLYFISHGQQESFYVAILRIMSWVLAGWMILIIFKLYRQAGHSMFHLFSYICATELIPFLITIKVLYY